MWVVSVMAVPFASGRQGDGSLVPCYIVALSVAAAGWRGVEAAGGCPPPFIGYLPGSSGDNRTIPLC